MYEYEDAWIMTAQLNEKKDGCELCMRPLVVCKDCKYGARLERTGMTPLVTCKGEDHELYWFCADGKKT